MLTLCPLAALFVVLLAAGCEAGEIGDDRGSRSSKNAGGYRLPPGADAVPDDIYHALRDGRLRMKIEPFLAQHYRPAVHAYLMGDYEGFEHNYPKAFEAVENMLPRFVHELRQELDAYARSTEYLQRHRGRGLFRRKIKQRAALEPEALNPMQKPDYNSPRTAAIRHHMMRDHPNWAREPGHQQLRDSHPETYFRQVGRHADVVHEEVPAADVTGKCIRGFARGHENEPFWLSAFAKDSAVVPQRAPCLDGMTCTAMDVQSMDKSEYGAVIPRHLMQSRRPQIHQFKDHENFVQGARTHGWFSHARSTGEMASWCAVHVDSLSEENKALLRADQSKGGWKVAEGSFLHCPCSTVSEAAKRPADMHDVDFDDGDDYATMKAYFDEWRELPAKSRPKFAVWYERKKKHGVPLNVRDAAVDKLTWREMSWGQWLLPASYYKRRENGKIESMMQNHVEHKMEAPWDYYNRVHAQRERRRAKKKKSYF